MKSAKKNTPSTIDGTSEAESKGEKQGDESEMADMVRNTIDLTQENSPPLSPFSILSSGGLSSSSLVVRTISSNKITQR